MRKIYITQVYYMNEFLNKRNGYLKLTFLATFIHYEIR